MECLSIDSFTIIVDYIIVNNMIKDYTGIKSLINLNELCKGVNKLLNHPGLISNLFIKLNIKVSNPNLLINFNSFVTNYINKYFPFRSVLTPHQLVIIAIENDDVDAFDDTLSTFLDNDEYNKNYHACCNNYLSIMFFKNSLNIISYVMRIMEFTSINLDKHLPQAIEMINSIGNINPFYGFVVNYSVFQKLICPFDCSDEKLIEYSIVARLELACIEENLEDIKRASEISLSYLTIVRSALTVLVKYDYPDIFPPSYGTFKNIDRLIHPNILNHCLTHSKQHNPGNTKRIMQKLREILYDSCLENSFHLYKGIYNKDVYEIIRQDILKDKTMSNIKDAIHACIINSHSETLDWFLTMKRELNNTKIITLDLTIPISGATRMVLKKHNIIS
jgi:hypothetical protein